MGAQEEAANGANVPEVVASMAFSWHLPVLTLLESLLTAA